METFLYSLQKHAKYVTIPIILKYAHAYNNTSKYKIGGLTSKKTCEHYFD